jgi:hypothetical protein
MYKLNFLICVLHQKDIRDLQPLNKAYFPIALHEQKKTWWGGRWYFFERRKTRTITTAKLQHDDNGKHVYDHMGKNTYEKECVKVCGHTYTNRHKQNRAHTRDFRNFMNVAVLILSTENGARNAGALAVTWSGSKRGRKRKMDFRTQPTPHPKTHTKGG